MTLLLAFYSGIILGQVNEGLVSQLDSLKNIDQKWRQSIRKINNGDIDSLDKKEAIKMVRITDSLNYLEVKRIFDFYGFPGYNLVGENGSYNFWLLVQHQDKHPEFPKLVLDKMKIETEKNNASRANFAYLTDRVAINMGELQVYGTQMRLNQDSTSYEPMPVLNPEDLNERRSKVGLSPIENYIKIMNERYFGSLKKQ